MITSTKTFILSEESVNKDGFRVITNGIELEQFYVNPLMLWMHFRATKGETSEVLPIGYWSDIKIQNNQLTAVPVFDDSDSFAMNIYNKVENGTLKMASAGLSPVEWSNEPAFKIIGQTGQTLLKSVLVEASVVDSGTNQHALAVALFDNASSHIALSDRSAFAKANSKVVPGNPKEVNIMLSKAFADGKISTKEMGIFKLSAVNDFNTVKEQIDKRPLGFSLTLGLDTKSFEELDKTGKMELVRKYQPDLFRKKFFEQFGKNPQ